MRTRVCVYVLYVNVYVYVYVYVNVYVFVFVYHVAVGFHVVFLFDRCFGQLGPSQLPRWLGFRRIWTWVFQCPSQSLRAFQESLGLLATVKGYGFSLK